MEHSFLQLIDLPDELLLMIFKNLKKALTLYSLLGINKRFDKILRDPIFVSRLTLMTCASNGLIYPMRKKTIDRFCFEILPQIHYKIEWLNVEVSSMERLLLVTNYPNLHGLGLYNIEEEIHEHIFTDESCFAHIFKNQISTLFISFAKKKKEIRMEMQRVNIFRNILTLFTNLRYLNFDALFNTNIKRLSLNWNITKIYSSLTLKELHINVQNINDCLYILDGCFDQLEKFYVNIDMIYPHPSNINDKEKIPNMKCFSLTSDTETEFYEEIIVPLVHRMSNLESLALYIVVDQYKKKRFLDGNDLKKNIIDHLPQLNKFVFNIHSSIGLNQSRFFSNEEIQSTFTNFKDNQIISCVSYFPKTNISRCHIYSFPYTMRHYNNITNNFPGGLFNCVRRISLVDQRPFEHKFFIRVSQAFPFLKILSLKNREPQRYKQIQGSIGENSEEYLIIKYPHLIELYLSDVHDDYIEQFLSHTKTCFMKSIKVYTNYESLRRVTDDFTKETTRANCRKITNFHFYDRFRVNDQFIMYLPHLKIRSLLFK